MALLLLKVCGICYALTAGAGVVQLVRPSDEGDRTILVGLLVSAALHAVAISTRALTLGAFPVFGLADGLSLFALVVASLAVWLSWRTTVPQAAAASGVLVASMVGLAVLFYPAEVSEARLRAPYLPFHISFAFLGLGIFAVAGLVAAVYLVQERRLKSKATKRGSLRRLPPLEVLDRVSSRLMRWGFPLLGLGLLFGVLHSKYAIGEYWRWNVLNTLGLVVWCLYAVILNLRWATGWRGRQVALLTLIGVTLTIAAVIGLSLSGTGPHGT